jgi:hypothetical protein
MITLKQNQNKELVYTDITKPGRAMIIIGGVRPPKKAKGEFDKLIEDTRKEK